jgi:Uma2 family endonuclease
LKVKEVEKAMANLAHGCLYPNGLKEERRKELIGGIWMMSPAASVYHNMVKRSICRIFDRYLMSKKSKGCRLFDEVDVYLTEEDNFQPDVMIVCNKDIIKPKGVFGAPDLVVEILSPSTASRDRGRKKDIYEKCGVKELWLVDINNRSIEVYLLIDGKYRLGNIYHSYEDNDIEDMTDDEKSAIIHEFKVSIFDDLIINVDDVFADLEI